MVSGDKRRQFFNSEKYKVLLEAALEQTPYCQNCAAKSSALFYTVFTPKHMSGDSMSGVLVVCDSCRKKCAQVTNVADRQLGRKGSKRR